MVITYKTCSFHEMSLNFVVGVMGPDEYATNVNNSVVTNFNARLSLQMPLYLLEEFDM